MANRVWAILFTAVLASPAIAEEKPPTTWNAAYSGNYSSISYNRGITHVVIHTIEGSAAGAISWFKNSSSNVSAHYVINYDGSITQMVQDKDIAWHAGNSYYNAHSIGIEHAGYANQNYWTTAMYAKSAALTRWICIEYGIPMTRQRILGHNEVPDPDGTGYGGAGNHTDPGPYFNWNYYMSLVTQGSTPAPAPAPTSYKAMEVTASTLNVRSGPSTGYSVIGTIPYGQRYVSMTTSSGWHKVWYKNNTGWCYAGYLAQKTGVTGALVTVGTLNVRTGPGTGYAVSGTVSSGQRYVQIATSGGWRKIYWGGQARWIYADYSSTFGM